MRWRPVDEGRHDDAPGIERWSFEFGDSRVRGIVGLTLDAARGRAAFVTDLALPGADRVVVADEDVPLPRATAGLEVRADGLWASLYCETPFEHWTLGLEAFGLRVDVDAATAAASWDALVGDRLPVGFDLEWECVGDPAPHPLAEGGGYRQDGIVHGTLLLGRDRIEVDAAAVREHAWGSGPGVRSAASELADT